MRISCARRSALWGRRGRPELRPARPRDLPGLQRRRASGIDLTAFLGAHCRNRAEAASIALTRVKDPTLYGLVETESDGRVRSFLEKPSWDEIRTNTINAGACVFEPQGARPHPRGAVHSLERGLFPALLELRRRLFGWVSPATGWTSVPSRNTSRPTWTSSAAGAGAAERAGPSRRRGSARRRGRDGTPPGAPGPRDHLAGRAAGRSSSATGPPSAISSVSPGASASGPDASRRRPALEDCVVLEGTRVGRARRSSGASSASAAASAPTRPSRRAGPWPEGPWWGPTALFNVSDWDN